MTFTVLQSFKNLHSNTKLMPSCEDILEQSQGDTFGKVHSGDVAAQFKVVCFNLGILDYTCVNIHNK